MRTTFRMKLLAIMGVATLAFAVLFVIGAQLEQRAGELLTRIAAHYVPRIELGPRLLARFDGLVRGLNDAVAAEDPEALDSTRLTRDELLSELDRAYDLLDRSDWILVRAACRNYYSSAFALAQRTLDKRSGEAPPKAIAEMQAKQRDARVRLQQAVAFDQTALTHALAAASSAQQTASQIRLVVSVSCLGLVLFFCMWLSRSVLRSLREIGGGFARFGRGDFDTAIRVLSDDEFGELAEQANQMAASLKTLMAEQTRSGWLSAGVNGLLNEIRGELEPEAVAKQATSFLARYLDAPAAALYWADTEGDLWLLAHCGAALGEPAPLPPKIERGSGLLGHCASEQEICVVTDVPDGYFAVASALGGGKPRTLVMLPLVRLDQVAGVVELALFAAWNDDKRDLLLAVRESIAIAIEVARARASLRTLLEETQQQATRLRNQEDELRSNYDELQAQQEELLEANEALHKQAGELENHRKELEANNAELQRTRRTLERKAQELTTVSAYKSQFLANMSHELRTPLNSMLILSNLLAAHEAGPLTEKQTEYCRTIHGAATDLLSLINQVLDLAKVEAGKQDVTPAQVPLRELAAYARRLFGPLAQDKGLDFMVEVAFDRLPEAIFTDRRKVEQILNNLLGNAIKFTDRGRVSLWIAPADPSAKLEHPQLRVEEAIVLSVADTGNGIAREHRERIFAPFEQLDGSTDRRFGGSGLGLSIARQLAGLLGGELRLDSSSVGQGSVFSCYLPPRWRPAEPIASKRSSVELTTPDNDVAPPKPSLIELPARVMAGATPSTPRRPSISRGGRVLIVEDDRHVADMLAFRLGEQGLDVVLAANGRQAIERLTAESFSCLVLDLGLPDIDGITLLETMRTQHAGALPPVLVQTGRALDDAQLSWLETHAEVVVLKEGLALDRLVDEVRLLTRRLEDGVWHRPGSMTIVPASRVSLQGRKLLVADDDMRNVYALCALFRARGIEVTVAENGRAALEALDAHPGIELVLMDMMMPELDGYDAMRAIRRDARFAALPIIALTAKAMKNDRERCMLAGATEYMSKPIDGDLLFAMIGSLLTEPMVHGRDRGGASAAVAR